MIKILDHAVIYYPRQLGEAPKDLITLSAVCKYRLSTLAAKLGVSAKALDQEFRTFLDCSPDAWLAKERTQYAKKLLLSGFTIELVATKLGFSDSATFSRDFNNHTGVSPSIWLETEIKLPPAGNFDQTRR